MEKLSPEFPSFTKNLVGIVSIMEKLIPLYLGSGNRVYMLGICGMGGWERQLLLELFIIGILNSLKVLVLFIVLGKDQNPLCLKYNNNYLEKILGSHEKIWDVYEGVDIIKRRLCHKKFLLVLDDVDHVDKLENWLESITGLDWVVGSS